MEVIGLTETKQGYARKTKGYPARDDLARHYFAPWRGYTVKTITHPHFGPKPVEVFAIRVNKD